MMVAELAVIVHLRETDHQALTRRHIGEHLGEQILHELERSDWLTELQALLGVLDCRFEGAHLDAGGRPTHHVARHAQYPSGIAERVSALEPVRFWDANVLHRYHAVLDDLQRDLVLDFLNTEAGRGLVLNYDTLDLI